MSFLDEFFDKIGNEIEWGTKRVVSEPGKVAVDIVDTALGQNQPLNPLKYVGDAIRGGIGSAGVKGEGLGVLERARDENGKIIPTAKDYLLRQDSDKLTKAGLKAAKGAKEYKVIGNEGFSYVDPTTGNVRTIQELDRASSILNTEATQLALAKGATIDPYKDSQTKITTAGLDQGLQNKATAIGASSGLNLSDDPGVRREQLQKAIDDQEWTIDQGRKENSFETKENRRIRKEELTREDKRELSRLNLDLATLANQSRQADLDREYLDSRDMREYEYKMQKDDMARMDRVFELILGISKGAF